MGLPAEYNLSPRAAAAQARADTARLKSIEGEYREGPYHLPISGGWLPSGTPWNFWQTGQEVVGGGCSAMAEACVSAYAQTVAMCPGNQWRWAPDDPKGRVRVTTSSLVRILRYPNDYQTISDFLLNGVRSLLEEGNLYALVLRNDRFEPATLHLMNSRQSCAQLGSDGSIFYHLAGNEIIDRRFGKHLIVPARDVLHVRLHTPRHPLVGEAPIEAAALELASGSAALMQQVQFYKNQARPSFILTTEKVLTKDQVRDLREIWDAQSQGMNQGRTPILSADLKAQLIGSNAKDSDLAQLLNMSREAVALVYRTPLQIHGIGDTPFASTETLMQSWRAGGLGFLLNHIEEAIGLLFGLKGQPDEYVEFDTSALMRSAFKDRVEGWVSGVKGGIFDRNAARQEFEMGPVAFGDEPWVQQQDVPLSVAGRLANEPKPVPAPAAPPDPKLLEDAQNAAREQVVALARSCSDDLFHAA